MAEVVWQIHALEHLAQIAEFIGSDSESSAIAMVRQIDAATDRLRDFPMSGRQLLEGQDPNLREVIVENYRLIYDVKPNAVRILAVIHGAQNLDIEDIPHD